MKEKCIVQGIEYGRYQNMGSNLSSHFNMTFSIYWLQIFKLNFSDLFLIGVPTFEPESPNQVYREDLKIKTVNVNRERQVFGLFRLFLLVFQNSFSGIAAVQKQIEAAPMFPWKSFLISFCSLSSRKSFSFHNTQGVLWTILYTYIPPFLLNIARLVRLICFYNS